MMARMTALALLAAACSGGGGGDNPVDGGGGTTSAPETAAAYCDQLWTAYAARWAACDRGSAAHYAAYFDPTLHCADAVEAIAAGRATYQRSSAAACLDFVAGASCDELEADVDGRSPAPACLAAVAGALGTGASCYSNESCASDACLGNAFTCPSTCAPRQGLGGSCALGEACAPGLHCEHVMGLATFQTCQPLAATGGRCMGDADCEPRLFCDYDLFPYACQPRKTSGSCTYDSECAIAYACLGSSCVLPAGQGDPCTPGTNQCGAGLWCSGGHCVDGATAGYSCASVAGEQVPCIGSRCDPVSSRCVAWSEGSACNFSWECAPTMACDANQCATPCPEP